jgi:hypothetical protein
LVGVLEWRIGVVIGLFVVDGDGDRYLVIQTLVLRILLLLL